ncbi:MAG: hypothetical protein GSR85_07490 [Desulfurococcales archaeon]|nr:hypothetical protein [Desulfurococcales archaeon]
MKRIRRLGIIHSLVKSGYVVVKLEGKNIRTGTKALWNKKEIGIVNDLIGNIESPYALIKLANRNMLSDLQVGDEVYYVYQPPKKRGRGKRRGRRDELRNRGGKGGLPRRILSHRGRNSMQKHGRSHKR